MVNFAKLSKPLASFAPLPPRLSTEDALVDMLARTGKRVRLSVQ